MIKIDRSLTELTGLILIATISLYSLSTGNNEIGAAGLGALSGYLIHDIKHA